MVIFYINFYLSSLTRLIILFCILTTPTFANKICEHCKSEAHKSEDELCLRCGRLVKDCDWPHTVIPEKPLTYEDVINAPNSNALINILFKIRKMYSAENYGKILSLHDIYKKASAVFEEKGIVLPEKGLKELKNSLLRIDLNRRLLADFAENEIPEGFDRYRESQEMLALAKDFNPDDECEYPEKLRFGVALTYCGLAMTYLSEGLLAPFGWGAVTIGTQWTAEGVLEYNAMKAQKEKERLERKRIEAEKEAKRIEKEKKRKAEKEKKHRQKEEEKQRKKAEKERKKAAKNK